MVRFIMHRPANWYCLLVFTTLVAGASLPARAQVVEVFGGHKRAGVDVLWFKYFKDKNEQPTPWLLFSRNRATVDYSNKTQIGSTTGLAYMFKSGIGVVTVHTFTGAGYMPKAGVQYARITQKMILFGWITSELFSKPNLDLYGFLRFTPRLNERFNGLLQLETINVFPTHQSKPYSFTQRLRLGLKRHAWGFGCMAELSESGRSDYATNTNVGAFVRRDF